MDRKILELFACPKCGAELRLEEGAAQDGRVSEGLLLCAGCSSEYPIIRGMPRFVPSEDYADTFGYQWNRFDRLQLDRHTQNDLSRERFFATTGWPARLEGQRILEAGCGMGRFTQIALETGAEVFSFDLSNAVQANYRNNGDSTRAHIFQASIYQVPLRKGIFDKVFCMGVLQHCPDVKAAFMGLVPYLRPGGEIVVDCYLRHKFIPPLKYWVRPLVRYMKPQTLHKLLSWMIPPAFEVKKALHKIPLAGTALGKLIPIGPVSHKPKLDYTDEELFTIDAHYLWRKC